MQKNQQLMEKKLSPDSLDRFTSEQEFGVLLPYYYLGVAQIG